MKKIKGQLRAGMDRLGRANTLVSPLIALTNVGS